ncbi:hypothetical protein ES703_19896 [subsurface metagenome]
MKKRKIIISVVVALCFLVGVFFVIRFGFLRRIDNAISRYFVQSQSDEEVEEELMYETELDKDGTEYVIEYRKKIVTDLETGEEVEMWEDTADPIIIYDNYYKGKIDKIEDNKIYFIVDKENKSGGFSLKDVEDYEIVFDIDTFDFKEDPHSHYWPDSLLVDPKDTLESSEDFYSVDGLEFLVGEYLRAEDVMFEDYYTEDRYKMLVFYLQ